MDSSVSKGRDTQNVGLLKLIIGCILCGDAQDFNICELYSIYSPCWIFEKYFNFLVLAHSTHLWNFVLTIRCILNVFEDILYYTLNLWMPVTAFFKYMVFVCCFRVRLNRNNIENVSPLTSTSLFWIWKTMTSCGPWWDFSKIGILLPLVH